jgi:hypothetical protein
MHRDASMQTYAAWGRVLRLFPTALALSACRGPIDEVSICILASEDRIVVSASAACASDHKGATLSCKITQAGNEFQVSISGREGRDPNDACARDLVATCESEPLSDGEYTVRFDDEEHPVSIPNEDSACADTTG